MALPIGLLCGCVSLAHGIQPPAATRTIPPNPEEAKASETLYGVVPERFDVDAQGAPKPVAGSQRDRPASEKELAAIGRLMQRTEVLRGLSFLRPFHVRVQTRARMREYMRAVSRRHIGRMRRVHRNLHALGLLERGVTVDQLIDASAGLELEGYYDPPTETLVLRDDVAMSLVNAVGARQTIGWRGVVVHELVHVLQDQHFGTGAAIEDMRTTDADQAYLSLIEGDATLFMMRFQMKRTGVDFEALLADEELFNDMLTGLPPIHGVGALDGTLLVQPMLFRYQAGALFSAGVVRHGGVQALARAFDHPPRSTYEVFDYGAYIGHHGAPAFRPLPEGALRRRGYQVLAQDVLGQVHLSHYLRMRGAGGDLIASGWQADRLLVFRRGGQLGSVWVIEMANEKGAEAVAARGLVAAAPDAPQRVPLASGALRNYAYVIRNVAARDLGPIEAEVRGFLAGGGASRIVR